MPPDLLGAMIVTGVMAHIAVQVIEYCRSYQLDPNTGVKHCRLSVMEAHRYCF